MQLTGDSVLALAPDASSAVAGKKLANARHWRNLGQNAEAVWGECQGSALYQVRVELAAYAAKCTCPSHKFPCKHSLGLLLLAATTREVPDGEPPTWVTEWLGKRMAAQQPKTAPEKSKVPAESAAKAQTRRVEKREALVAQGLDSLDVWLSDLVRTGLAGVEAQPATFWEREAAQMVDAQAPGIAARLRRIAEIPGASSQWPEKLLAELGRLALLTEAYRRSDALGAGLREDVRQLVGWTLKEEEVAERGEVVTDDWLILGQHTTEEDRGRVRRTWLLGKETERPALIVQYSFMGQPFKELLPPGVCQRGDLALWPGAAALRARFVSRTSEPDVVRAMPGRSSIAAFLASVADALARQPWQDRLLCALQAVTPVYDVATNQWYIRDAEGAALPLAGDVYWKLLAVSGGAPVDFAGEWDGERLLPLGAVADGTYYSLEEVW
ncbi:MAG: SWIM zinc finger family protein [Ktedonobacterales bacterium]